MLKTVAFCFGKWNFFRAHFSGRIQHRHWINQQIIMNIIIAFFQQHESSNYLKMECGWNRVWRSVPNNWFMNHFISKLIHRTQTINYQFINVATLHLLFLLLLLFLLSLFITICLHIVKWLVATRDYITHYYFCWLGSERVESSFAGHFAYKNNCGLISSVISCECYVEKKEAETFFLEINRLTGNNSELLRTHEIFAIIFCLTT